jgi:hypothetical protein
VALDGVDDGQPRLSTGLEGDPHASPTSPQPAPEAFAIFPTHYVSVCAHPM